ncbi:MAG TPA: asparagine synthase-related protein, partial [Pilimelia sp.]|nr:asparagine synthase-related protein [Pilimelia sp.]
PWIGAAAARRAALPDRLWALNVERYRARTDPARVRAVRVSHPHVTWQLEGTRDRFAAHGVAWRHPLHDQRIADLVMRLPGEVLWRPDQTKSLLRAAVRDLLPPEILRRQSKTTFEAPIVAAIRAAGGADSLVGHPLVTEGYLDLAALRELERLVFADYDAGAPPRSGRDLPSLWAVYSTATWFSQVWPS